jgi:transcriptional regulator with XRE-family HTH domain
MNTIGERIAHARRMSGLSAAALGERAGLSKAIVAMLEGGQRENPHVNTVSAIARILGVRVEWLISGTGDTPDPAAVKAATEASAESAPATGTDGAGQ